MTKKNMAVSINRKNKLQPYAYTEISVPKKSEPFDLIVLYDDDPQIVFEIDVEQEKYEKRKFLSIKMGQEIPDDMNLLYLGTIVLQKGHIIEQVYEVLK